MITTNCNELVAPINKDICYRIINSIETNSDMPYEVLMNARNIINILTYHPHISCTFRHTIQFEYDIYDNDKRCYFEIEIYSDKFTTLVMYDDNYQSAVSDTLSVDIDKLSNSIDRFFDVVFARLR